MREDWEVKHIGDVCDVIPGQSPKSKYYNTEGKGVPFYQGKKRFTERYIDTPVKWTTKVKKEAQENDILMSVRAPVGPVNFTKQKICIGRGLAAIRAKEIVDKEYIFYFLLKNEADLESNKGAVFDSINSKQIRNIEIPIPPLPEQKRIVAILDEAFEAIDKAKANVERNIENAEELFQSKLNLIFSQRVDNWEEKKLGDVYSFKNGLNFTKDEKNEVDGKGVLTIDVYNMYRGGLTVDLSELYRVDKEVKDSYLLMKGDVLFVRSSLKKEGVAWTTYFTDHDEDVSYCGFIIRGRPKKDLNPEYSVYYCRSPRVRNELINRSVQSTITNINQKLLSDVDIPIPDKVRQAEIVKELKLFESKKNELVSNYEKRFEDLTELKKSILQKAFSGELTENETVAA